MTHTKTKPRLADLSPLVLRFVVAGVLALAAADKLGIAKQPVELAQPAPVETAPDAALLGENTNDATPISEASPIVLPTVGEDKAALDASGLQVNFGWKELTGLGEIGFAAVLLFGVLTRLAALAGIGMVKLSALTATGIIGANTLTEPLANMYAANPVAMLLFGAICVSLLISGSGPLSLDRILFRKRAERDADTTALS